MTAPVRPSAPAGGPRLRYLSVCSGIEVAALAWVPLGWSPVLVSEIEAFPREVLRVRHGAYAVDYAARNRAGSQQAQRGSDKAAATRRRRTRPVTLARSAADEVPVALPTSGVKR